MLVFLLDCLRFSKLLKILSSVWYNFSNLLNTSNSVGKQTLCATDLSSKYVLSMEAL